MDHAALMKLTAWLSPAFPVGAFSYSGGLEWAVAKSLVTDAATLEDWLTASLTQGALRNDAIFLVHAWRAIDEANTATLNEVARLAEALQPSAERHMETMTVGTAFLSTIRASWPCAVGNEYERLAYPVAVGATAASHAIPLSPILPIYLHACAANIISAGIRLIPIGQTDGQKVLAALSPIISTAAEDALTAALDDVGSCTLMTDFATMAHETMETRLFRT